MVLIAVAAIHIVVVVVQTPVVGILCHPHLVPQLHCSVCIAVNVSHGILNDAITSRVIRMCRSGSVLSTIVSVFINLVFLT